MPSSAGDLAARGVAFEAISVYRKTVGPMPKPARRTRHGNRRPVKTPRQAAPL